MGEGSECDAQKLGAHGSEEEVARIQDSGSDREESGSLPRNSSGGVGGVSIGGVGVSGGGVAGVSPETPLVDRRGAFTDDDGAGGEGEREGKVNSGEGVGLVPTGEEVPPGQLAEERVKVVSLTVASGGSRNGLPALGCDVVVQKVGSSGLAPPGGWGAVDLSGASPRSPPSPTGARVDSEGVLGPGPREGHGGEALPGALAREEVDMQPCYGDETDCD